MLERFRDVIIGAFLLICSIGFYIYSYSIKTMAVARIGPAFVPRLLCIIIGLLSIILIIKQIMILKQNNNTESSKKDNNKEKEKVFPVVATIVLLAIYISLLEEIGFVIMTILYLVLQCSLLKTNRTWKDVLLYAVIGIVISVSVYYLFVNVFQLMLPAGILG